MSQLRLGSFEGDAVQEQDVARLLELRLDGETISTFPPTLGNRKGVLGESRGGSEPPHFASVQTHDDVHRLGADGELKRDARDMPKRREGGGVQYS